MGRKIKLSYILLGLGIGIILTNFIYYISPRIEYRDLSDDEIIEKAKDLGMVFVKDAIQVDKVEDDYKDDYIDESNEEELEEIVFKVEEGQNLTNIAENLYRLGLIDDISSFINYCKERGITSRLRVGTYKLTTGMDYETLVKILTKSLEN